VKTGFVGVGKMGRPMAGHLLKAGHSLAACDLAPALVDALVALGATRAATPADAAREAEVVFSSLPDDAALRKVAAGVLAGARPGTIFVDTSTVSPAVSAEVAADFAAKRVHYLRVAVSGNNKMAEQAALTMAIVMEAGMKRKGKEVDRPQIDALKSKIIENFERQQSAFVTSALMLDDGIIDPRDTRNVLGLALAVCRDADARQLRPVQFGVARP